MWKVSRNSQISPRSVKIQENVKCYSCRRFLKRLINILFFQAFNLIDFIIWGFLKRNLSLGFTGPLASSPSYSRSTWDWQLHNSWAQRLAPWESLSFALYDSASSREQKKRIYVSNPFYEVSINSRSNQTSGIYERNIINQWT